MTYPIGTILLFPNVNDRHFIVRDVDEEEGVYYLDVVYTDSHRTRDNYEDCWSIEYVEHNCTVFKKAYIPPEERLSGFGRFVHKLEKAA